MILHSYFFSICLTYVQKKMNSVFLICFSKQLPTFFSLLVACGCDLALTLAKGHRCIPLVDPLCTAGARGTALTNKPKALVAAEAQGAAQFSACKAVHCAIHRVVVWATVSHYEKRNEIGKVINMHIDNIECNRHKKQ